MSLGRPRRKPIFHKDRHPWRDGLRTGAATAAMALAALMAFKAAGPELAAALGMDTGALGSRAAAAGAPSPASGCVIKGNIAAGGERIYHMPGQAYYDATRISLADGERWFCSEDSARRAGWRKART